MKQKVVIGTDDTKLFPVRFGTSHVAPAGECFELNVSIDRGDGLHKLASSVLHRGAPIAQAFHDCGRWIVHIPIMNVYQALTAPPLSGRQIMFSSPQVRVQGQLVGFGLLGGDVPTPMLACGTIPLPIGDAETSATNGIIVGISVVDLGAGVAAIAFEMALGLALFVVGLLLSAGLEGLGTGLTRLLGGTAAAELASTFIGEALGYGINSGIAEGFRAAGVGGAGDAAFRELARQPPDLDPRSWALL